MAKRTDFNEWSPNESMKYARDFMKRHKQANMNHKAVKAGNLLFLKYDAKDKSKIYDKNPLVLVLWNNGKHTLGLNFHWLPYIMRIALVKKMLSENTENIKKRKPLDFDYYRSIKPFMKKHHYDVCIRKYINNRFSKKGYIVPSTLILGFARLNMMLFTGGLDTGTVYRMAQRKQI